MQKRRTCPRLLRLLVLALSKTWIVNGLSREGRLANPISNVVGQESMLEASRCLAIHPVDSSNAWGLTSFRRSASASSSLPLTRLCASNDSAENLLDLESPLSPNYNDDDDGTFPPLSALYGRDQESLGKATDQFLNDDKMYALGKLTEEDMETITGLMAAWARRRSLDAALKVEALLKRVIDDLKAGNTDIHVRTQHYTLTIDAWSKSNAEGASERAQQIHDTMREEYEQTKNMDIRPNVLSCTTLANAWAKSNETHAPVMAERVLQSMIDAYNNGEVHMKPDAVTFSTVMDAYSRSPGVSGPDACRRCEELFRLMDSLGVRKNVYTFSALQNVYARSGLPDALERTTEVLEHMQRLYQAGDIFAKPNCRNYNAVLNAASRTNTEESARFAQDLLKNMESPSKEGGFDVEPDRVSYTLAILACSRIPNKTLAAEMSLATLEQMENKANEEAKWREQVSSAAPPVVRLDVECFNVVLTALSRTGESDSPSQIRRLLRKMQEYAAAGRTSVTPNVRSWNTLLNSLARSRQNMNSGRQAHGVLRHMFRLHCRNVPDVLPDAFSFAAVLTAYQRVATVESALAADKLVAEMEKLYEAGEIQSPPDVYHYTILAGVWAKSEQGRRGADRSVEILTHMMERHKGGFPSVKPNVRTFNAVLDCLARADDGDRVEDLLYHMLTLSRQGDQSAKPDSFSFNCAISAFTRSKRQGSGRRAEAILDLFLEYQENENPSAVPDARSFTNIIAHYGRSRWLSGTGSTALDAPYRAEYIFNRMVALFKDGRKYLEPNIFAVTTVIDSYSYAKHPDAGSNAERLLRLVINLREKHGAKRLNVNTALLNSVLFAWANSGDTNSSKAAAHVEYMENEYAAGNVELRPDTRSYSLLLSAISKSTGHDKARKALDVINRMKEQIRRGNQGVTMDEHHYSLAINACAFSNADIDSEVEAFQIATKLFEEVMNTPDLQPTSLTFGWFIQACGRLRVPEAIRNAYIERAFNLCCERGLVNDFVLRRLLGAGPEDLLGKLLAPLKISSSWKLGRVNVSMLPAAWTARTGKRKSER
eukprot:scaffold362_cov176-Amphora_coffeaeformis.AAC.33